MHAMYLKRVVLLLLFCVGASALDISRNGRRATRQYEYGFLLLAGAAAAVVGMLLDAMTCRISPEYFVLGKGLPDGAGLSWDVAVYGLEAGFSAGIVAAAAVLFANSPGEAPRLAVRELVPHAWKPAACAAGAAAAGFVLSRFAVPVPHSVAEARELLTEPAFRSFVTVWLIHVGTYVGLATGTVWWLVSIVRIRKREAAEANPLPPLPEPEGGTDPAAAQPAPGPIPTTP